MKDINKQLKEIQQLKDQADQMDKELWNDYLKMDEKSKENWKRIIIEDRTSSKNTF